MGQWWAGLSRTYGSLKNLLGRAIAALVSTYGQVISALSNGMVDDIPGWWCLGKPYGYAC